MTQEIIAIESVAQRILVLRGHKVIIDADLAELYGVPTKALNQAVHRNLERFPADFMFQLTQVEKTEVVTNCDHLARLKYSRTLPYAFTEHGALMLGNVLKSERAVEMSLLVVRTFVQLREMLSTNKELAAKLLELERKVSSHDQAIVGLMNGIRELMKQPEGTSRPIGFTAKIKPGKYISKNCVIPAEAGIQMVRNSPRKWDDIKILTASQFIIHDWIPASAGMTA